MTMPAGTPLTSNLHHLEFVHSHQQSADSSARRRFVIASQRHTLQLHLYQLFEVSGERFSV